MPHISSEYYDKVKIDSKGFNLTAKEVFYSFIAYKRFIYAVGK